MMQAGSAAGSLGRLCAVAARPGLLGAAQSILPSSGQVRFKRKIFVKRPHQPDWFRKQLLGVSKPQWDETVAIEEEPLSCGYLERQEEKEEWRRNRSRVGERRGE